MENIIQNKIDELGGYLYSLKRNTEKGYHFLTIGLPKDWTYKSNDYIECEVVKETPKGIVLNINPKKENIVVDDLFSFVGVIVETNSEISKKEEEFTEKMNEMKADFEKKAKSFYEELDKLREDSFKNFKVDTTKLILNKGGESSDEKTETGKKRGRPRKKETIENDVDENGGEK